MFNIFYEGQINLVVVRDQDTGRVSAKYNSLTQFLTDQVANIVTEKTVYPSLTLGLEHVCFSKKQNQEMFFT